MTRRIAPLNALRAFEAAARHMSFTKAADELAVTPAAISHQVKALEDHCGVELFRRLPRGLILTDAGQRALPLLRDGFARLADATEGLRDKGRHVRLSVAVSSSFAAKWLVPRLHRFQVAHPKIDVRIDASTHITDFAIEEVDLAVRYGLGNYPGLVVAKLLDDVLVPVCSPRLMDGPDRLSCPDDLARVRLLHAELPERLGGQPNWKRWLETAGVGTIDGSHGMHFTITSMAIQAAIGGHGVALVSAVLVEDDLAAGLLVKPFPLELSSRLGYWLVMAEGQAERPHVAAFRNWLEGEARDRAGTGAR